MNENEEQKLARIPEFGTSAVNSLDLKVNLFQAVCRIDFKKHFCRRTAVENGQAGEVCPAAAEQDGGVSFQSAYAVPIGVLQAGCYSESRHSHRDAVTLQTTAQVSVYRQQLLQHNVNVSPLLFQFILYHLINSISGVSSDLMPLTPCNQFYVGLQVSLIQNKIFLGACGEMTFPIKMVTNLKTRRQNYPK